MSDISNLSRPGQANQVTADPKALFLKVFGGEVLTTFNEKRIMDGERHMIRTISSGKSAQFPVIGTASASYHTPGQELTANVINHNERVIEIDDMLISDVFVASIDEAMNHYDVRGPYAEEVGEELANTWDKNVMATIANGARETSPTVTGNPVGDSITDANADTDGSSLVSTIYDIAQKMDENDVPDDGRYVALKPAQYYNVIEDTTSNILNRDYGGAGSISQGTIPLVGGITVLKSNHVPSTNVTGGPSAYQGNFSNTVCVAWQKSATGTVQLVGMRPDTWEDKNRRGHWIIAEMAVGSNFLRPECCFEVVTA